MSFLRTNMSFASEDEMEEGGSLLASPPRSCPRTTRLSAEIENMGISSRCTPSNRRLFDDNESPPARKPSRTKISSFDRASSPEEAPLACRKRSSAERRGEHADGDPTTEENMYASPKMSPNSYITMDGRFVQSKNPFSSPMVTSDATSEAAVPTSRATAPAFPSFQNADRPAGFLPPRHKHASPILNQSGYPHKRFSFTGSPVKESSFMMETDTATSGSLNKVRRLHQSDDIVAASGHDIKARQKELQINTNVDDTDMSSEISPTDVLSFPPPAPVKSRPPNKPPPYARFRLKEPQTPERRRRLDNRTPHPGGANQKGRSRFHTDFDIISQLGKGSFGTVFKVLSRLDGCMYAIKVAERAAKGVADRGRMLKEVYALAALSDQANTATFHIVRYHQAWMEDDRLYIQTELCTGTLRDELDQGRHNPARTFKLIREVCLALNFIHGNNMVHLDIKKENIFIKNDQFKLGDFGLVTKASSEKDVEEGDSRYMSLELLSGEHDDLTKSDIFSLGATMYEIYLGRDLPMDGPEWQDIRAGRLAPIQAAPMELITHMMHPNPSERPTASALLEHYPQLWSDEQKSRNAEKKELIAAAARATRPPPPRKGLTRANTWNGSSMMF